MHETLTEEQIQGMATQARTPHGEFGVQVGHIMHRNNIEMTRQAYRELDIQQGHRVLEIGHGNAGHLDELFATHSFSFSGLEVSDVMHSEAIANNHALIDSGSANFHKYDGTTIPFDNEQFDRIVTVNTIYFWDNPQTLLSEIKRVLMPGGLLSIAFVPQSFMEQIPFSKYGFTLYTPEDVEKLLIDNHFQVSALTSHTDIVERPDGTTTSRPFSVITATT